VKFILPTTARRDEAAKLCWSEITGRVWTLPAAPNNTKVDLLRQLPQPAHDLLGSMPRYKNCDFVVTNDGRTAVAGFSKFKAALQQEAGTSEWTLHGLRRTARSLVSRAGVPSEHA
jgi:integrase